MSKNIAIDARFWRSETGGLGRYTKQLVHELTKLDKENNYTIIITPDDEPEYNILEPNFKPLVVDIPTYSTAEQTKLLKLLRKEKFDLVHFAQFNHPIFYKGPFVVTIHDIIMHMFPGEMRKKSWVRQSAYRKVFNDCKRAKRIIVPSLSTKNDLVEKLKFPADKISITNEGSEEGFRVHTEKEKNEITKKYSLPSKFLLFVSRWEEYKGLLALLDSHKQLSKKYPDLGLVIAGKPDKQNPQVAQLVKSAQEKNKNIITPGFIPDKDLSALYSAATVYVHPSWYEGFGIMILEAFASGVPVVTSNVSSLPEVVGDAGLLVDPKNTKEITNNIEKILRDPTLAEDLVRKGLNRAGDFSWGKMAEETLAIYEQILVKK